jgi:fermentation-respiration switch protein FrsA (DUF1100 family)
VLRASLAALAVAVLLLAPTASPAPAFFKQDVTIPMDDGAKIAATIYHPDGEPPAGGWPAIVFMHGLGGNRQQMNTLVESSGFAGPAYVILTFDARGHGQSEGLIGIDGSREKKDMGGVFHWLNTLPEVNGSKIGAFGISYGGGAALNSLTVGIPWAALEVAETWTDLYSALVPDDLPKSGVIAGFLAGLSPARLDPSVLAIRDDALAGRNLDAVRRWAAERSSLPDLRGRRTPVFFMQGRRDFAFGIDQATRAYSVLKGPKRLWIGNLGHPPSTFPAVDTPKMLAEGKAWFDHFLRGVKNGIEQTKPVTLAAEASARVGRFAALPRTAKTPYGTRRGQAVIMRNTKIKRSLIRTRTALEVFGSPSVTVPATAEGGWSRLVAVLSARTSSGKEIVIADGGTRTRPGRRTYDIHLQSQATFVPKGSRLTLTLAASSTAQSPSNLVYLDLPIPAGARLTVGASVVTLPTLATPVTR